MAMTEAGRFAGVPAAPGVARGAWVHVRRRELPVGGRVAPGDAAAEVARLRAAADTAADDLMALSERVGAAGHEDEAAIFMAHAAMAWDPTLIDAAAARITGSGEDGVAAIQAAGAAVAAQLAALDDPILSARGADVIDVADRIARLLAGLPGGGVAPARGGDRRGRRTSRRRSPRRSRASTCSGSCSRPGRPRRMRRSSPARTGSRPSSGPGASSPRSRRPAPDAELALDGETGEVADRPGRRDHRRARRRRRAARDGPGGRPRGGDAPGGHRRRRRGDAARQHRHARGGGTGPRAGGARRRPVPDRVPVPRAGHARRPRTSRPRPTARRSRRSAATRSRSGCWTSAATSRSRTCRCRPRTTRSSASGRCGSPWIARAVRHPAPRVLPGGGRGPGQGHGADGR